MCCSLSQKPLNFPFTTSFIENTFTYLCLKFQFLLLTNLWKICTFLFIEMNYVKQVTLLLNKYFTKT